MATKNFVISIGGTGAKVVEAIVYLSASGIIKHELHVVFVDQDRANGNLNRTITALENYISCRTIGFNDIIFSADLTKSEIWTPIGEISTLESLLGYHLSSTEIKHLYDVLFSKNELRISLNEGFRGHPTIGACAFLKAKLEGDIWEEFFGKIRGFGESGVNIFLIGSIFGGTGASGLPNVARLIRERLKEENIDTRNIKFISILVLPYFTFIPPQEMSSELYADASNFALKSKIALNYYYAVGYSKFFDSIYILGLDSKHLLKNFSLGSKDQKNESHIIELIGALAIPHYIGLRETASEKEIDGVRIVARSNDVISWEDIPHEKVKEKVGAFTRFAVAFRSVYYPILKDINSYKKHNISWFIDFFKKDLSDKDLEILENLQRFLGGYLSWLYQIHTSSNVKVELIDPKLINKLDSIDSDGFSKLILNVEGYFQRSLEDIWERLCNYRTQRGIASFLQSLYKECQLEKKK